MITPIFCHRNGGYENSPLLGQYCGSNLPPRLISHSNKLWLKFKSDFFGSGPGFSAYWDGSLTGKWPRFALCWRIQSDWIFHSWIAVLLPVFVSSCILSVLFVINFNLVNISELTLAVLFLFLFLKDIVRENVIFLGIVHQAGHLGWEKESTLMCIEILGQLVFGGAGLFCNLVFKGSDSSTV